MKVILYMAISVNGMIAKEGDDTSFVTDEEWESYKKFVKKTGCIICGRRTYELALKEGNLLTKEAYNVVLTKNPEKIKNNNPRVWITDKEPKEILKELEKRGFKEVIIGGGGGLNASFMKEGLIDEMYTDVESKVFGKGIPLFAPADFEFKLKLLGINKLSGQTVQLHYAVLK